MLGWHTAPWFLPVLGGTDRRHLELAQRKPCIAEERAVTEDTVVQVFVLVSQFSNCPPLSK